MTDTDDGDEEFDEVRARAAEAMNADDVVSAYVGLIHENDQNEFYFGNAVDEAELRRMATRQLGMLTRVLADQSGATAEEIAQLAAERAEEMDLRG